ncbi:vitamin D(3) 25-hydroxylase-like [Branchiostoma lanceolatum]|uniref:vitamin D(3) 25-hydroxylase-like n=1 Tax=Branchiostoma lanceolatum TaxID=7740 RepID=UPI00345687E2
MAFGKRYDYEDETFLELSEAVSTVLVGLGVGQIISVFPLLRFVPIVNRAGINALQAYYKVLNVISGEISRHREHLDRENPRDFLDFCLLELEQQEKVDGLTEGNVLYMAGDLFAAGTETTANTLLWSLLYMTLNPDVQDKVQEELDAVVGESLPTLSHRAQLPYVNACLLEVMRIRNIITIGPHATTEEVKVQGYDIPKGIQVQVNLHSLHMDAAYWPDPDQFDPERFLDAEGNVINKPESFLPFGGGRRRCPGEQLARMETFLFFSTLLQSFSFKTPEGAADANTDGVFGMTLAPHPFQLCAIPRRVPVLGHLLALGRAPHRKLTAWRRQYGDVFTVRMGMKDVVVLNGYTAVKDALVDRSELFCVNRSGGHLLNMADTVQWIAESVREILQISGLTLQMFLVFCATFLVAYVIFKRSRNLPPYPAGCVPVLGHLRALGRAPHLKLAAWRRQYGDVFTVRMGMEDVVVLNGYTAVKDALVDRSDLFASTTSNYLLDAITGSGKASIVPADILAARWGPGFRQRKRFATTALRNLGMKVGRGSIEEKIREEVDCLRYRVAENNGQPFDIAHDVKVTVANVICSMVFGKRYDYEDETFRELSKALVTVAHELGTGQIISVFPLLRVVPVVNRASTNVLEAFYKGRNVISGEISRHREHLDRENPRDFLDFCLLELEQQEKVDGLTEENVLYMALDLLAAGTDTTANTLLWSLLYMTLNPDIQDKVQEELGAVVGESLPTLSHRAQLPYVNACLLEVMRIRPVLPFQPHATTQEVKVQGHDIPKGTQVLMNLYSLHTDPAYWPDPDRFDPERFLDAEGNVINKPESFMPFGGGRRRCLGEQLARMELFLSFSTLLQSFTFKTPEGAPPPCTDGVFGLTLAPHPFQLCAIPR